MLLNVHAKKLTLFPKTLVCSNPPMKDDTIKFLFIFWSTTPRGIHENVRPWSWGFPKKHRKSHVNWGNRQLTSQVYHSTEHSPFPCVSSFKSFFGGHFLKTNSHFSMGQIWRLKFWWSPIHQSERLPKWFSSLLHIRISGSTNQKNWRDVEISADQIAQTPPCRNVCQPRLTQNSGGEGFLSKTRVVAVLESNSNLKVARKPLGKLLHSGGWLLQTYPIPTVQPPVVDRGIFLKVFSYLKLSQRLVGFWRRSRTLQRKIAGFQQVHRSMGWACNLYQNRGMLNISTKNNSKRRKRPKPKQLPKTRAFPICHADANEAFRNFHQSYWPSAPPVLAFQWVWKKRKLPRKNWTFFYVLRFILKNLAFLQLKIM